MSRTALVMSRTALVLAIALVVAGCSVGASGDTSPGASAAIAGAEVGSADASETTLVDIGAGLKGPAGLTATEYASGLPKASAFAFDTQGRLWVATADYSDSGSDGLYLVPAAGATPVEVVEGLHTPLGLVWYAGSLYVSSAGGVVAYERFNGHAFADRRTVIALPTRVGEVNGLALASDGRMWLGISASCDDCTPTIQYSASVVSFLPDGSDLRVEASGIRAPVGLTFYPGTNDLYVTMNQRDDLGTATPGDSLSIVGAGQAWGFPDCYGQGGTGCAGVPAPVAVLDPHAAVSGVAIVTGQLGTTIGDSALVAEWSLGMLRRVALTDTAAGTDATPTGTAVPFLAGLTNPVALTLGPDDAVYVGDWTTGIVYRVVG
jgi:glucose/arabinose dehydrogenase